MGNQLWREVSANSQLQWVRSIDNNCGGEWTFRVGWFKEGQPDLHEHRLQFLYLILQRGVINHTIQPQPPPHSSPISIVEYRLFPFPDTLQVAVAICIGVSWQEEIRYGVKQPSETTKHPLWVLTYQSRLSHQSTLSVGQLARVQPAI
jgi:hypothetical protein